MKIRITGRSMPKAQFGINSVPTSQFGMPTSMSNGAVQYNGMQLNTNNPGDIGLLKQALDSKGQFNTSMTTANSAIPNFTTPNYNRVNLLRSLAPKSPSLSFKPFANFGQASSINPFSQSSNILPSAVQPMGTAQSATTQPVATTPDPARKWHSEWDDQGYDTDPNGVNYQAPETVAAPAGTGSKFGDFMQKYNTKIGQPMEKAFQGMDQLISLGNLGTQLVNGYKKKKDFDKYMRRQTSTDSLFPEVTSEMSGNRGDYVVSGSRTGEFRPDEYVVNKGMYTGQFLPRMAQYGGGIIPDALTMPIDEVTLNQASFAPTAEVSTENNTVNNDIKLTLSDDFKGYADTADSYIKTLNPNTDITGSMLASGAQKAYQKYGKIVPVELALAQLQVEGYLADTSKPNKPQRTKNPFNVGNTDSGNVINHNNLQSGVDAYYNLLSTQYLSKKTPEQLLNNFTNTAGERYATDKKYENTLKTIVSKIKNKKFENGGVYELTEHEIKHILASGGEVEFL